MLGQLLLESTLLGQPLKNYSLRGNSCSLASPSPSPPLSGRCWVTLYWGKASSAAWRLSLESCCLEAVAWKAVAWRRSLKTTTSRPELGGCCLEAILETTTSRPPLQLDTPPLNTPLLDPIAKRQVPARQRLEPLKYPLLIAHRPYRATCFTLTPHQTISNHFKSSQPNPTQPAPTHTNPTHFMCRPSITPGQ